MNSKKTGIQKGATIGANATILCGTNVGAYALIGAGAVVTKNVKPYALMVGNPAVQSGWVSEAGCTLHFNNSNEAVCEYSGQKYLLVNGNLQKQ